jgi:uncharacterized protein YceH (UPF0502 family)
MKRSLVVIICCVLLLIGGSRAQAQVNLESRVIRLENELFAIQSQLSQLTAYRPAPRTSVPAPAQPNRAVPNSQFDRLATLVIELKERINKLEAQVQKLNSR